MEPPPPPFTSGFEPGLFEGLATKPTANFASRSPRFNYTLHGMGVGPGEYDVRTAAVTVKDALKPSAAFASRTSRVPKPKPVSQVPVAFDAAQDAKRNWGGGGTTFSKSPRFTTPRTARSGADPPPPTRRDRPGARKATPRSPRAVPVSLPGGAAPQGRVMKAVVQHQPLPPLDLSFLSLDDDSLSEAAVQVYTKTFGPLHDDAEEPCDAADSAVPPAVDGSGGAVVSRAAAGTGAAAAPSTGVAVAVARPASGAGTPASPPAVIHNPYVTRPAPPKMTLEAVRACNNDLRVVGALPTSLAPVLRHNLTTLRWLDLSYNRITAVNLAVFTAFPALSVLNLHCNAISTVDGVRAAGAGLTALRSLTLYENPVARQPKTRLRLIAAFPSLKKLDAQVVTPKERHNAARDVGVKGKRTPRLVSKV